MGSSGDDDSRAARPGDDDGLPAVSPELGSASTSRSEDDTAASPASGAGDPAGTEGIGVPPATPIASLPPLPASHRGVPLSPRTGEPNRPGALVATQCLLYASAAAAGLGYAQYWWTAMHVERFFDSAWLIGWLRPRPGGAGSVWLVIGLAACVATMVTATAVSAYQAWTGERFSRRLGVVAMAASLLGVFFNPLACLSIPLTAVGLWLLWRPSVTRYFEQWETLREAPAPKPAPVAGGVLYGRLPRFE